MSENAILASKDFTAAKKRIFKLGGFVHAPLHFLNLDNSPRINTARLNKYLKDSGLQAHARLAQMDKH